MKKNLYYGGWRNPPPADLMELVYKICEYDWSKVDGKPASLTIDVDIDRKGMAIYISKYGKRVSIYASHYSATVEIQSPKTIITIEHREGVFFTIMPEWRKKLNKIWSDLINKNEPNAETALTSATQALQFLLGEGEKHNDRPA